MIQILHNTVTTYTDKGSVWEITKQIKFLGIPVYFSKSTTHTIGDTDKQKPVGFQVGGFGPIHITEE